MRISTYPRGLWTAQTKISVTWTSRQSLLIISHPDRIQCKVCTHWVSTVISGHSICPYGCIEMGNQWQKTPYA
jgi:hypothetical protein